MTDTTKPEYAAVTLRRSEAFWQDVADLPWVQERLSAGQQFNAYDAASNDEEDPDEDCEMHVCIGPINDAAFIVTIDGRAKANMIANALTLASSHRQSAMQNVRTQETGSYEFEFDDTEKDMTIGWSDGRYLTALPSGKIIVGVSPNDDIGPYGIMHDELRRLDTQDVRATDEEVERVAIAIYNAGFAFGYGKLPDDAPWTPYAERYRASEIKRLLSSLRASSPVEEG